MFRIRMTESERAEIDAAAESEDMKSSEWARSVLVSAARRRIGKAETGGVEPVRD